MGRFNRSGTEVWDNNQLGLSSRRKSDKKDPYFDDNSRMRRNMSVTRNEDEQQ